MNAQSNKSSSRLLLHPPSAGAVERVRNNAASLMLEMSDAQVCIILNGEGVLAVLDNSCAVTDGLTLVCSNTLIKIEH